MTIEILILTKLIIFALVWYFNAHAIVGFNRACQYQTTEVDENLNTEEGSVKMVPRGTIIPETKMFLWRVKKWCDENVGMFWSKPIYSCCTCMPSLHGALPFLITCYFITGFSLWTFPFWLFYTLSLSGYTTYLNER